MLRPSWHAPHAQGPIRTANPSGLEGCQTHVFALLRERPFLVSSSLGKMPGMRKGF